MDKLLIYLGETVVAMAIFYSAYWLVLRKGTNHKLARFYLLGTLVLALVLSFNFLNFNIISTWAQPNKTVSSVVNAKQDYKTIVASISNEQTVFRKKSAGVGTGLYQQNNNKLAKQADVLSALQRVINGLLFVYLIGVLFLLIRFVWQLVQIKLQIVRQNTEKDGDINFVYIDEPNSPYSFMNYLFVPQSIKQSNVFHSMLEHEIAHIRQRHTYDLLFMEVVTMLFWINPFVWFIRNSLRKVHEYLADEQVIKRGYNISEYQELLLEGLIAPKTVGLTSAFHFKPLKQRLAMIRKLTKNGSKKGLLLRSISTTMVILLTLAIGIVVSCANRTERAFQLVTFSGNGEFYNFSTTNFGYILSADSVTQTAMLARTGDVLAGFDEVIYHRGELSYSFTETDGVLLNNGKVFSINFSENPAFGNWLSQMDTVDLAQLNHVTLSNKLPANYIDYLKQIAQKKPNIGLNIDVWNEETPTVIGLFNPSWLALSVPTIDKITALPVFLDLEMLVLSVVDGSVAGSLKSFPKLKHLVFTNMKSDAAIDPEFLTNNLQVESVVCADCKFSDFRFLNKLRKLNSLMVLETDTTIDIGFIKNLKSLTRLSLMVDKVVDWNELNDIPNLKWLALSGDISQHDFNEVIATNPKLEVLEIVECDSINSLAALSGLKSLKALTVSDTLRDWQTPLKLNRLEYISIPKSAMADSVYVTKLQAAIPNGMIVPNDGFCMGSGWVILFLPIVLALAWMRKKFISTLKTKIN